ncbi:MAG: LacI family transcriptional regulator [Streptosporangiaceae bacterium]|nr:LacI family transcriptional regulator [Streptosporangiaceae bacterium]
MDNGDLEGKPVDRGSNGRRHRASSKDIAREANVSQSTVSRVIHDSARISQATRERVLAAMDKLGYSPNAAARTLITGRSNFIGLVVSNITNPFYPEVIESIVGIAAQHGYNVLLCNTQEDRDLQASYLDLLIEHQIDGAILTSTLIDGQEALAKVHMDQIPVVMVNRTAAGVSADAVRIDNFEAGRVVAAHLADLGHTELGFIGGLEVTSTNRARMKGFRQGLGERGIELRADRILHGQFTRDSGYRLATRLIAAPDRPTALFCADDIVAFGTIDAVMDAGLRVPEDVAIVGVDDVPAASLRQVGLTTVRQPAAEMGRRAFNLLLERIEGVTGAEPVEIVLRPQLIVRRTSGAPEPWPSAANP